jgi:DNA helicase-2/ATP-dependent DNA helicase PcrA
VWEAAAEPEAFRARGRGAQGARALHCRRWQRLRERAEGGAPVGELLAELLQETGYTEALQAERTIERRVRMENLEELVQVAREYDGLNREGGSLGEFLQQISLLGDADSIKDDEGLVTLMTLHTAKGLEFGIVFLIGMEDGVFPHSRALDEGGIEEERRLAYVGITRAMRDLYLTSARRRNAFGAASYGLRSRFLDEIPRELTDQSAPAHVGAGWSSGGARSAGGGRAAISWGSAQAAPEGVGRGTDGSGAAAVFRIGDDVVHAAFGDGVVTGVEPGGVVTVRFAGDGSERKLMADYAPIRRRS